jgi:hypothetical protein
METRAQYKRRRSCTSKHRYRSRRSAHMAAQNAARRTGKPHRIYPCDYGEHFHITSKCGKEQRMYRKEIVYSRETRDYAMYLDGELVGFARTYHEAEITLDQLVFELMSGQFFRDSA